MCFLKKKRIKIYLNSLSESKTAFDLILSDYLDGTLKYNFKALGLTKIEIIVDYHNNDFCIGVQAKYKSRYIDMQIYQGEFSFSHDVDEPDEEIFHPLESRDGFYHTLKKLISALK